ncbi:MAG: DUF58 domain-containing protein [Actinomycetota bacterium]|nr:DUF58 domain-containing protein [Actinomycetota bacterium]
MSRGRVRLGLTTRGSALLTAGLTAAVCGLLLGQRDLVRVAVLLVAAPLVASVVVSRSRLSVACSRSLEANRIPPGVPVLVQLTLTNQSLLPTGSLMLQDALPPSVEQRARFTLDSLRGRESRALAYQLPLPGRGRYRTGPLSMRVSDPFGLVERTRSFRSVSDLVVLPAVEPLPGTRLPGAWNVVQQSGSRQIGTHGSDDASVRAYRHGDDLRKVHWRSTARHGSTMVRQEERPWHGRTAVLLDTRASAHRHFPREHSPREHSPRQPLPRESPPRGGFGPSDPAGRVSDPRGRDSFEWAVSAAASVAHHLQELGRDVDLVTGPGAHSAGSAGAMMDVLVDIAPAADTDLRAALASVERAGGEASLLAILGQLDDASLRLMTRTKRSPGAASALLLDVGGWSLRSDNLAGRHDELLRHAEIALASAGWRVVRVSHGDSVADAWAWLTSKSTREVRV